MKGFTVIELAVVTLIMTVILGALVAALRVGDLATGIDTPKVDLQSDARNIMALLSKDIRQAKIQELYDNTPATGYMKFNLWVWNNTSCEQEVSGSYVEYEYDAAALNLSRRLIEGGSVSYEQNYTHIAMAPFYTSYTDESTNEFDSADLLSSRTVIVAIKKEKTARNSVLNYTLVEEVRIRNE